jgi:hypothetical protein
MILGTRISKHPWLFFTLSISPSLILTGVLVYLAIFAGRTDMGASVIPDWAWYVALGCLPVLAFVVGLFLAYLLSYFFMNKKWQGYLRVFVVVWNLVFSFLSFFVFAMGLGDAPAPASWPEFISRVNGVLLIGFPEAIFISLIVCAVLSAVSGALLKTLMPGSNSKE